MFNSIVLRFRIAKVQAELKAQHNDQRFVNEICQDYNSVNIIDFYFQDSLFRKRKDAGFLVVCAILAKAICLKNIDDPNREICYLLLRDRVDRINSDSQYASQNSDILSDCNLALKAWRSSFTEWA
ncbi:Uncharacterised protein [Pragia fontium]|nr:Uncharacterised protein [Pragia fontium]